MQLNKSQHNKYSSMIISLLQVPYKAVRIYLYSKL